jgi:hypothetical protein
VDVHPPKYNIFLWREVKCGGSYIRGTLIFFSLEISVGEETKC